MNTPSLIVGPAGASGRVRVFNRDSFGWDRTPSIEGWEERRRFRRRLLGAARSRRAASTALDTPLPIRGDPTLRTIFQALRDAGVKPHGVFSTDGVSETQDEQNDEAWAQLLHASLSSLALGDPTEAGHRPNQRLCLVQSECPRVDPTDPAYQRTALDSVGSGIQIAADLARAGLGRIRRVRQSDVYWGSLFPYDATLGNLDQWGALVLRPDAMLDELRAPDASGLGYARFGWATGFLVACLAMGVKVDLTPFNVGGGGILNYEAANLMSFGSRRVDPKRVPIFESGNTSLDADVTYEYLALGRPPWQTGLLVPSGLGWDDWYWAPGRHGPLGGPAIRTPAEQYQRFVVNVWPTEAEWVSAASGGDYAAECARRKSLAIAAFSTGVGEWLAAVNQALSAAYEKGSITDVVDTIDLCNETTAFFAVPAEGESEPSETVLAGAREAGRYLALIAGPIRHFVPAMRFRTEIASWGADEPDGAALPPVPDNYERSLAWLQAVLEVGIPEEVERWTTLNAARLRSALGGAVSADATAWFTTEGQAGFSWPPVGLAVRAVDLVHEVGVHWFHDADTRAEPSRLRAAEWKYADEVRLAGDVALLNRLIRRVGGSAGYSLSPVMMALNFPSLDPGPPSSGTREVYLDTSEQLQAAKHVRLLASGVGAGLSRYGVFTFVHGAAENLAARGKPASVPMWEKFFSNGIHNDVIFSATSGLNRFQQAVDCWPRPSWYAIRRLTWFLNQVSSSPDALRIEAAERGLVVVGFQFATAIGAVPDGYPTVGGPWARAYLVWMDQYADNELIHTPPNVRRSDAHVYFVGADVGVAELGRTVAELVPLVPTVAPAGSGVDGNGYALAPESYSWPEAGSALVGAEVTALPATGSAGPQVRQRGLRLTLQRTDPATSTGLDPILILTNLEYWGSR